MNRVRILRRPLVCVLVTMVVALNGCGDDKPTAQKASAVPTPAAGALPGQPAAEAAPQEATAPSNVVVRRFKPARDPFRSIYQNRIRVAPAGGAKHPLQQYSIGQLRLLGIITGIAEPVALVATPSDDEYIVRTGTPVGTGDGRVVAILPDRVVIVEKYYDYRGQLQTEKYELVLAEEGK